MSFVETVCEILDRPDTVPRMHLTELCGAASTAHFTALQEARTETRPRPRQAENDFCKGVGLLIDADLNIAELGLFNYDFQPHYSFKKHIAHEPLGIREQMYSAAEQHNQNKTVPVISALFAKATYAICPSTIRENRMRDKLLTMQKNHDKEEMRRLQLRGIQNTSFYD